jgi:leader peptidase (prepilin peptidase)/N-methyltransferase
MMDSIHSLQFAVHGLTSGLPSAFGVMFSAVDSGRATMDWSLLPFHFWSLCFFVLGCMVGSFLNVCIHRMPLDMSIVSPRSHCPHCKYAIPWYLNLPLITWLALRGRCKNCGAPIAPRYFIVELLTGVAFLGCWLAFGSAGHPIESLPLALVYAVFISGLIVATFIDFEHLIIPDEITLGGMVVGLLASFLFPVLHGMGTMKLGVWQGFIGAGVGAGTVYAVLRLGKWLFGRQRVKLPVDTKIIFGESAVHLPDKQIAYEDLFYRQSDVIVLHARTVELVDRGYQDVQVRLSPSTLQIGEEKLDPEAVPWLEAVSGEILLPREAMGLGDVKFMGAIGAFIGWQGVFFTLTVSSLIGAIYGGSMVALKKQEWSGRLYFGPFIALAAAIYIFAGTPLVAWYQHLMLSLTTMLLPQ